MTPAFHNPAWFRLGVRTLRSPFILGYTGYFILRTLFGSRRAADMRLRARHQKSGLTSDVLCGCVVAGIALGAILHGLTTDYDGSELIHTAEAATTTPIAKEVRIAVEIDWTPSRIETEIRNAFPEQPNTAYAVAMSEGGMRAEIQSHIYKDGVREPSFCAFQIHEPTWMKTAKSLGYGDYKTNPKSCISMARYIYETAGNSWSDWSGYNNGSYKKFLE